MSSGADAGRPINGEDDVELAAMLRPLDGTRTVLARPDGARLHVLEAGVGAPVLLAHGYGGSLDQWSVVQPALVERGHRVIAYDHRAHGQSTPGNSGLSSRTLFEDLRAIVEHYDLHELTIVGHSMGTYAALGALGDISLQARVRLVVLASPQTGRMFKNALAARLLAPLALTRLATPLGRCRTISSMLVNLAVGADASPAAREASRRILAKLPHAATPLITIMDNESLEQLLPTLAVPIRVLWGTEDRLTPSWHAELITRTAPNAQLMRLPGIGHMVPWEAPDMIINAADPHDTPDSGYR